MARQLVGQLLGQAVSDVDPEPVDATVCPEPQRGQEVLADRSIVPVEVGLFLGEEVQVPLAVAHRLPGGAAEERLPVGRRHLAVLAEAVAEDVTVPLGRPGRSRERRPEPLVPIRGVVRHDVDDDPDAGSVQRGHHLVEVVQRAELRIDGAVVVDVVAAIGQRRGIERTQPDGVDAELGEVGHPRGDPSQVSDAVTVRVGEAAGVDLVDERLPPPVVCERVHDRVLGLGVHITPMKVRLGMVVEDADAPPT